MLSKEKLN